MYKPVAKGLATGLYNFQKLQPDTFFHIRWALKRFLEEGCIYKISWSKNIILNSKKEKNLLPLREGVQKKYAYLIRTKVAFLSHIILFRNISFLNDWKLISVNASVMISFNRRVALFGRIKIVKDGTDRYTRIICDISVTIRYSRHYTYKVRLNKNNEKKEWRVIWKSYLFYSAPICIFCKVKQL